MTTENNLLGKLGRADQIATHAVLSEEDRQKLVKGDEILNRLWDEAEDENQGGLPDGFEDEIVGKVEKEVPGYGDVLQKWAESVRKQVSS